MVITMAKTKKYGWKNLNEEIYLPTQKDFTEADVKLTKREEKKSKEKKKKKKGKSGKVKSGMRGKGTKPGKPMKVNVQQGIRGFFE